MVICACRISEIIPQKLKNVNENYSFAQILREYQTNYYKK